MNTCPQDGIPVRDGYPVQKRPASGNSGDLLTRFVEKHWLFCESVSFDGHSGRRFVVSNNNVGRPADSVPIQSEQETDIDG